MGRQVERRFLKYSWIIIIKLLKPYIFYKRSIKILLLKGGFCKWMCVFPVETSCQKWRELDVNVGIAETSPMNLMKKNPIVVQINNKHFRSKGAIIG
jgi:hypothetical protein